VIPCWMHISLVMISFVFLPGRSLRTSCIKQRLFTPRRCVSHTFGSFDEQLLSLANCFQSLCNIQVLLVFRNFIPVLVLMMSCWRQNGTRNKVGLLSSWFSTEFQLSSHVYHLLVCNLYAYIDMIFYWLSIYLTRYWTCSWNKSDISWCETEDIAYSHRRNYQL
jgi:hypothetical protein